MTSQRGEEKGCGEDGAPSNVSWKAQFTGSPGVGVGMGGSGVGVGAGVGWTPSITKLSKFVSQPFVDEMVTCVHALVQFVWTVIN
jgi:hypothetical protein